MLSRGRKEGVYLYEITEQDLVLTDDNTTRYVAGNIVFFTSKKNATLGNEIAKADDLAAAEEYLKNSAELLVEHLRRLEQRLAQQTESLHERDKLMRDLTDDLESQRYSNQVLIAQLRQLKEQVSIERMSREEIVDDLEQASAETYSKELELNRVIEAKLGLEQELAAMITDLVELNAQNDDLKRRLDEPFNGTNVPLAAAVPHKAAVTSTEGQQGRTTQIITTEDIQSGTTHLRDHAESIRVSFDEVLTMASGKQIHIYHDFPVLHNERGRRSFDLPQNVLRFAAVVLVGLAVVLVASVFATAQFNNLSLGEALDVILKSLGL
ncbi:MAG: hypothetical protein LBC35_06100 [Coriobacteriales bacterium]|jgi:hypothetical protein|nr:hypothetical protein [Coriobacteriales bacterium]